VNIVDSGGIAKKFQDTKRYYWIFTENIAFLLNF